MHFLTTTEVARLLKITRQAVWSRIKAGKIDYKKVGKQYAISDETIQHILNEHKVEGSNNESQES